MLAFATAVLTAEEIASLAVVKAALLAFAVLSTFPVSPHAQKWSL